MVSESCVTINICKYFLILTLDGIFVVIYLQITLTRTVTELGIRLVYGGLCF